MTAAGNTGPKGLSAPACAAGRPDGAPNPGKRPPAAVTACGYCGHKPRLRVRRVLVCAYHIDLPRLEHEAGTL